LPNILTLNLKEMKIAVFGTAVVGQVHAERLSQLKHEVMLGTRNVTETLARNVPDNFQRPGFADWHKNNPEVKIGTYAEAAAFSNIIINGTNGSGTLQAFKLAGEQNISGKVILDISNPLDFSKGFPPSLFVCNTDSLGEQLQREFPSAHVVKSLNTMNVFVQVNPASVPGDHTVFVNGNNFEAKERVREVLRIYGWKDKNMIDVGDITASRGTEQILPLWVRLWSATKNPMFNFHIATSMSKS
jgi:8-hydroxy-5-deazaflavin:NADPH oxidoreductase